MNFKRNVCISHVILVTKKKNLKPIEHFSEPLKIEIAKKNGNYANSIKVWTNIDLNFRKMCINILGMCETHANRLNTKLALEQILEHPTIILARYIKRTVETIQIVTKTY